jgi:hypothetical protein
LTISIKNDEVLTNRPNKSPKIVPERDDDGTRVASPATAAAQPESADVSRAKQRLIQETRETDSNPPANAEEARRLADEVSNQMTRDRAAALRAMGLASRELYEAATAPPA